MAQDDIYGLIEDLANPDSIVQEKATETIIQLGEPVIEPLIAALEDNVSVIRQRLDDEYETVEVRRGVVKILAQLGENLPSLLQNGKAMDLLLTALRDEDQRVRINALDALGNMRLAAAIEPIIAVMRDKNEWVRWHCAAALGKIGSEEAVPRLVVALREDRSWWVRYHAAEALGEIGTAEAIKPLLQVIQDEHEDERVKIKAQEATEKLRSCHSEQSQGNRF